MKEFSQGGIMGKAVALVRTLAEKKIPQHAAYACFFMVLASFPALVLVLGLLRYTGLDIGALTDVLRGVLPGALMDSAERLIVSAYRATSGAVVSVSAVVALWSASRGIHGIMNGLNAIYGVTEGRGYLRTRLLSVFYTFLFLLVLLMTLTLHVFGATVMAYLQVALPFWRFFLLLFIQTALFAAMFMALPNRKNSLRDSLPGALLASSGWLVFSDLYSIYVEHFSGYANIFGSVYAVALSMLWLYCCMSIVFYGGALNKYLMTIDN